MIPSKTPWLAALAWIVVATAYAWVCNRDYDDAVLAHHAQASLDRSHAPRGNAALAAPAAGLPVRAAGAAGAPVPTLERGNHQPTTGEHP